MVCDQREETIIKGIIVAYSRTGVSTKQISNAYYKITNKTCPLLSKGEACAIKYLMQIEGILSIESEQRELLWYVRGKTLHGENIGQIFRANNQPKTNCDLFTNPHGNRTDTCIQNNDKNNNNNTFRSNRNKNGKAKVDRNNNAYNSSNSHPRNRVQQKYFANNAKRVNGYSFGSDSSNGNNTLDGGAKTQAALYNYDLVGDDFFMELARIDLHCSMSTQNNINRSGLCISGQSIRVATENLQRFPNVKNMKIITNLGAVDILHGRDMSDICQDYKNLVKVCENRGIDIVLTTVPPLGNRLFGEEDKRKRNEMNEFIKKQFSPMHPVIDIEPCMVSTHGKVLYDCYQAGTKYVSGSDKPHLLWNRIGRQRILKEIKAKLRF